MTMPWRLDSPTCYYSQFESDIMKSSGFYTKSRLSLFRKLIIDGLDVALSKHYMKAFIEIDVTEARDRIREYRRRSGNPISFLSYFITCVSRTLQDHKSLNAGLYKNSLVYFDDIDVSVAVEMDLDDEKVPRLIVIRRAQDKTVADIHQEIAKAQRLNKKEGDVIQGEEKNIKLVLLLLRLPKCIRRIIWRRALRNPFFTKRMMGTVGITSLGMFGNIAGWPEPLPTSNHAVSFALGSIVRKPGVVKGDMQIRSVLYLTILIDHDTVDGAPAARFIQQLKRRIEKGGENLLV